MDGRHEIAELLQPSLGGHSPPRGLLSHRAAFWVSFFGGPMGALLAAGFNVHALRRLRADAWLLALMAAWSIAVIGVTAHATFVAKESGAEEVLLLGFELHRSLVRRVVQAAGLVVFGAFFFRHRSFQRAAELMDTKPARGWVVGLCCVGAGWALQFGLAQGLSDLFP